MRVLRAFCWSVAAVFLVCALVPLRFNVFHIGNIMLIVLAVLAIIFPFLIQLGKKRKWVKNTAIVLYSLGCATLITLSTLMLVQAYGKKPPNNGKITIITLGCQINGDQPSLMLWKRLQKSFNYLGDNPDAVAIMTGGQGDDEMYPEAEVMAKFLINRGIDPDRIFIENKSTNTKENLTFAQDFIPSDSDGVVIISDNFHQMRASIVADSLGMTPVYGLSSFTPYGLLPAYWVRDMFGVPLFWIQENLLSK